MFDENYEQNYSTIVKKWAKAIHIIGILLICLSVLVAFVLFIEDLLYVCIVAGAGTLVGIGTIFSGHLVWGFAEMVEKTQKIARTNHSNLILDHLKTSK